jgi:hypothetical protein
MATPTAYNNGSLVTSTTTEAGITIKGDYPTPGPVTVAITLRSGSLQATVQPQETVFSPVIAAGSYTTWANSTAGQQDKFFLTLDPVNSEIRMLGTATFSINW